MHRWAVGCTSQAMGLAGRLSGSRGLGLHARRLLSVRLASYMHAHCCVHVAQVLCACQHPLGVRDGLSTHLACCLTQAMDPYVRVGYPARAMECKRAGSTSCALHMPSLDFPDQTIFLWAFFWASTVSLLFTHSCTKMLKRF